MLGVWGELASHKRLFNPAPQFSRLGIQCPALVSCHLYLCMCFVWDLWIYVGGGFYLFISLSIYLSTYGWYAMNFMCEMKTQVFQIGVIEVLAWFGLIAPYQHMQFL